MHGSSLWSGSIDPEKACDITFRLQFDIGSLKCDGLLINLDRKLTILMPKLKPQ